MAIISFLIILSVLILVHELGHFLMAKKFGIKVEEEEIKPEAAAEGLSALFG